MPVATKPCWLFRWEALGVASHEVPVPDSAHEPCTPNEDGFGCACVWDYQHAMCVLDDGHAGEHAFVPQNRVTLHFLEAPC